MAAQVQVYTEENLKVRSKPREDSDDEDNAHVDSHLGFVQRRRRTLSAQQSPIGYYCNNIDILTCP